MGRKRSTGSRVMAYLLAHEREVLAAADLEASDLGKRGGETSGRWGKNQGVSNDTSSFQFTAKSIQKRLKVSNKDVLASIELLKTVRTGRIPRLDGDGGRQWGTADSEESDKADQVMAAVLAGRTPVRRWLAAVSGAVATQGEARAETDWAALALRSLTSLKNAMAAAAAGQIKPEAMVDIAEDLQYLAAATPGTLRVGLVAACLDSMQREELLTLRRDLNRRLEETR